MADYGLSANAQKYIQTGQTPPQQPPSGLPPTVPPTGTNPIPPVWNPSTGMYSEPNPISGSATTLPTGPVPYQGGPYQDNTGAWRNPGGTLYDTPPTPAPTSGGNPFFDWLNKTGSALFGGGGAPGTTPQPPSYGNGQGGPQGGQSYGLPPSNVPGTPPKPPVYGTGDYAGPPSPTTAPTPGGSKAPGGLPDVARDLSTQAREWLRIKPMADKYGASLDQLVNVYMNPQDPHAKTDLQSALSEKIADDVWARAFTMATGRPPQGNEWDEHYYAKTEGRRDPLEGHPGAVQYIQQAAQQMQGENSQAAYQTYNDLITSGLV